MHHQSKMSRHIIFFISLTAHVLAFISYQLSRQSLQVPEHWHTQFYILLVISLLLSAYPLLFARFDGLAVVLRFFILILIGYPLGESLGIEIILLMTIILECVFYLPRYYGAFAAAIIALLIFFSQKPHISWGVMTQGPRFQDILFMWFASVLVLILSFVLKTLDDISNRKSQDLARLDYAVDQLTKINLDYQDHAANVEKDSIEKERKRVTRELHDIIGYTLTNQLMIIQAALSMKESFSAQLETLLLRAQQQTREGLEDARRALRQLRDFVPRGEKGLKLIYKLTKTFEQVIGISVSLDFGNSPGTFGDEIDSALYRLIQEGMINAFRHGKASSITVSFFVGEETLHINIWDDGIGSARIEEGIGLRGMRERIEGLGGMIEVGTLTTGFTIKARIPHALHRETTNEIAAG